MKQNKKAIWLYNACTEPINSDDGWLWNYMQLCEEEQTIYKSLKRMLEVENLVEDTEDALIRIICANLYSCYEKNKKFNTKDLRKTITENQLNIKFERLRDITRLHCRELFKKILHDKDYKKFCEWTKKWGYM